MIFIKNGALYTDFKKYDLLPMTNVTIVVNGRITINNRENPSFVRIGKKISVVI